MSLSSDNIYVIVPLLRKEAVSAVFDRFIVYVKGGNDSVTILNYLESGVYGQKLYYIYQSIT